MVFPLGVEFYGELKGGNLSSLASCTTSTASSCAFSTIHLFNRRVTAGAAGGGRSIERNRWSNRMCHSARETASLCLYIDLGQGELISRGHWCDDFTIHGRFLCDGSHLPILC